MPQGALESASAAHKRPEPRNSRLNTWILRMLVIVAVFAGACMLMLALKWPFTKQALIDILQERSVRSVKIARFHSTFFPPGCVAEEISFLHNKHKNKPPLITIKTVVVQGSYWGLLEPHKHLATVRVIGMHVTVPPPDPNGGPNPIMPLTHSDSRPSLIIGAITADGAELTFIQKTPGNKPFVLSINRLTIEGVGNNRPLNYRAVIHNPEPPGTIESQGQFGTWNSDEPAATPVHGWYRFSDADLGVFKTIAGKLTSTGIFEGTLGQIRVTGKADVPDFHVAGSSHARELKADFHAAVAATDGNVLLDSGNAHFDRTSLICSGSIEGQKGDQGKAVSLDIRSTQGRIEDLFNLFIKDKNPSMTGNVSFAFRVQVPPKPAGFLEAMEVDGKFGVGSGRFTDSDIQSSLHKISNSAAKKDKEPPEDASTFVSHLGGQVVVRNGIANLSALTLVFPGGRAWMNGTYNLLNYDIDLHGKLDTRGSPSAAATGFKSFLLKAMTPFLKKRQGDQVVPFKITGNYRKVDLGLDLHRKG